MIQSIKKLLGIGPKTDYAQLMEKGAVIVDVRTPAEYRQGHISGSLNIPLQYLSSRMKEIRKDRIVITCCASGMRSGTAKNMLKSSGYAQVHNGGSWMGLQQKIR